jgi:hypothetical protein
VQPALRHSPHHAPQDRNHIYPASGLLRFSHSGLGRHVSGRKNLARKKNGLGREVPFGWVCPGKYPIHFGSFAPSYRPEKKNSSPNPWKRNSGPQGQRSLDFRPGSCPELSNKSNRRMLLGSHRRVIMKDVINNEQTGGDTPAMTTTRKGPWKTHSWYGSCACSVNGVGIS